MISLPEQLFSFEMILLIGVVGALCLCCLLILFFCYRERTKKDIANKKLEVERLRAINSSSVLMTPTSQSVQEVGESAHHEAGAVVDTNHPPGHVTSADGDFENTSALPQEQTTSPEETMMTRALSQELPAHGAEEENDGGDNNGDDALDAEMYGGGGGTSR